MDVLRLYLRTETLSAIDLALLHVLNDMTRQGVVVATMDELANVLRVTRPTVAAAMRRIISAGVIVSLGRSTYCWGDGEMSEGKQVPLVAQVKRSTFNVNAAAMRLVRYVAGRTGGILYKRGEYALRSVFVKALKQGVSDRQLQRAIDAILDRIPEARGSVWILIEHLPGMLADVGGSEDGSDTW